MPLIAINLMKQAQKVLQTPLRALTKTDRVRINMADDFMPEKYSPGNGAEPIGLIVKIVVCKAELYWFLHTLGDKRIPTAQRSAAARAISDALGPLAGMLKNP